MADDRDDDDAPIGPPPDPSLRQWRHPSEIASANAAARRDSLPAPTSRWRSPSFLGGCALGLTGLVLIGTAVLGPLTGSGGDLDETEILASSPSGYPINTASTLPTSTDTDVSSVWTPATDDDQDASSSTTISSTTLAPTSELPATSAATVPVDVTSGASGVVAILDHEDRSLIATGLVIDDMVISSAHQFEGRTQVLLATSDGEIDGIVEGTDPFSDLVVISAIDPEKLPEPILMAGVDADTEIATGSSIWLLTADAEPSLSMRAGELSALDEDVIGSGGELIFDTLQTTVRTPYLDAGSAVVDRDGHTIGMVISCDRHLAYAIPIESLRAAAHSIRETGWAHIGWLGIEGESSADGVALTSVESTGPAGVAGLQAGDRLTAIDDEPLRHLAEIVRAIRHAGVGNDLEFTVLRDGETITVSITVGTRVS